MLSFVKVTHGTLLSCIRVVPLGFRLKSVSIFTDISGGYSFQVSPSFQSQCTVTSSCGSKYIDISYQH